MDVRDLIEFLESYADRMDRLADLDEPTRVRLVKAAGRIARPDRYMRKALGKAIARGHKEARRLKDQEVLGQTGIRTLRKAPVFHTPLPQPKFQALDEQVRDDGEPDDGGWAAAEAEREIDGEREGENNPRTVDARMCYVCKAYFNDVHHFYDQMCGPCAELNWQKRDATADLRGRVVMITGARVKIGYQAAIKLLRAGAEVIVATRFPRDAARRFALEVDASEWVSRLHVYGIDLRHTPSVELLCRHLNSTLTRLDGLINNACQTVRRPSGWLPQARRPT